MNAVRAMGHEPVGLHDERVVSLADGGCADRAPDVDLLVTRQTAED